MLKVTGKSGKVFTHRGLKGPDLVRKAGLRRGLVNNGIIIAGRNGI